MNTLIYIVGDQAGDIVTTISQSEDDRKTYKKVNDKFEIMVMKRNVFELAKESKGWVN